MDAKRLSLESYRKGKFGEFMVIGKLLERGADLYLPVLDVGVDAIVRRTDGTCIEIQVKTTETYNQAGYFNVYDLDGHPVDRFFVICIDLNKENVLAGEQWPNIWVVTATEFREYMTSGHLLAIYERSRRHGLRKRYELLAGAYKAWHRLVS